MDTTFFLLLDASARREEGEQEVRRRRVKKRETSPAWYTGLAFLEGLSLAHLCQRDFVDAIEAST